MSVIAFARVAREELQQTLESVEAGILGGAKSWDEYQRLCGKRQGLQQALSILDEELSRMESQD